MIFKKFSLATTLLTAIALAVMITAPLVPEARAQNIRTPNPITVTAATRVLKVTECGSNVYLNAATGITVTLPAPATGILGCTFNVIADVSVSSANYKVITNAGTVFLLGAVSHSASGIAPLDFYADGAATVSINMDGAHLGGLKGTYLTFTLATTTLWAVTGKNLCTATCTTAFATS